LVATYTFGTVVQFMVQLNASEGDDHACRRVNRRIGQT
jgi:hypothetical protein